MGMSEYVNQVREWSNKWLIRDRIGYPDPGIFRRIGTLVAVVIQKSTQYFGEPED